MRVNLERDWFAPTGELFRRSKNPVNIPEHLKDALPTGAKVLETYTPKPKEKQTAALRDFDEVRHAAESIDKKINKDK